MWRRTEDISVVECEIDEQVVRRIELISDEEICCYLIRQPNAFRSSTIKPIVE